MIAWSGRDPRGTKGPVPRVWEPGWAAVVLSLAAACSQLPVVLSLADHNLYAKMGGTKTGIGPVLAALDRDLDALLLCGHLDHRPGVLAQR